LGREKKNLNKTNQPTRVYRPRWLYRIMNFALPLCVALLFAWFMPAPFNYLAVIIGLPCVAFWGTQSFKNFLKLTPEGMEYQYWPYYHVRCKWEDVDSLGKERRFRFNQEMLYLKRAEALGWQMTIMARKASGAGDKFIIPLTSFTGWPTGRLADDLRAHLPQIWGAK
jgi:hypothetical protein